MEVRTIHLSLAAALLAAIPGTSQANDSSAAIGLGGLELTRNDAIAMDSEDLFLSRDKIIVKYRFTNRSAKDVETLVSFPLPALPSGLDGYLGGQSFPDWKQDLKFQTLVDGKPVRLEIREVVTLVGRPSQLGVEKRLKELGWPVHFWVDYKFEEQLQNLPDAQKTKLIAEGLLRREEGGGYVVPNWQVATHVTRMQRFPAGKTISVEHSYNPVAGGSVGGMLSKQYRNQKDGSFADYAKRYCVDKSFLTGFDKREAETQRQWKKKGEEYGLAYTEIWLDYILKSGANWKGPIRDFRLVVDKGKPGNLVSFCMNGVKKIGPTRFEVRKTNFEPTMDLSILIVEFVDPAA